MSVQVYSFHLRTEGEKKAYFLVTIHSVEFPVKLAYSTMIRKFFFRIHGVQVPRKCIQSRNFTHYLSTGCCELSIKIFLRYAVLLLKQNLF